MSGTLISSSPRDIIGPMDIIGSTSWQRADHPYYAWHQKGLKEWDTQIARHLNDGTIEVTKSAADAAVSAFGAGLPNFVI